MVSLRLQSHPQWSATRATHDGLDGNFSGLFTGLQDRDLVIVLRPGDVLLPYAFSAVAKYATDHPGADIIYGDEESIDRQGKYIDPELKPDWSPIFQAERPYVGRAVFRRRSLMVVNSSDLWPRVEGDTKSVRHVRRVLLTKGVTAGKEEQPKPRYPKSTEPQLATTVFATIIIPTKDRPDLLFGCLSSLRATQGSFEVLIVDNGDMQAAMKVQCETILEGRPVRILPRPGPFNFSRICNDAAVVAKGNILVFLNDDTIVTQADWLSRLSAWATDEACGAIGPKLLYPSGQVQHGGLVIGLGGYAAHIEAGAPGDDPGYHQRLEVTHEVSAVTGACLAVEKSKFDKVCGFDAEKFPVELGDIDLCLRLAKAGWKTVVVPEVSLVHRESASRGRSINLQERHAWERENFLAAWSDRVRDDPYFHPALSLNSLRTRLDG